MNLLERADAAALKRCEKFSHRTQEWFGLTNFFWAKVCWTVWAFGPLPLIAERDGLPPELRLIPVLASGGMTVVFLTLGIGLFKFMDAADAHYASGRPSMHQLTLIASLPWTARALLIGLVAVMAFPLLRLVLVGIGGWPTALSLAMLWSVVPFLYFLAVVPRPRGTSKVRQFLESLVPQPEQVTVPAE